MAIKLPICGHYINSGWLHRIHLYASWTGIRTDPHIFQFCPQLYRGSIGFPQNTCKKYVMLTFLGFFIEHILNRGFQNGDSIILLHGALANFNFGKLKSSSPRCPWTLGNILDLLGALILGSSADLLQAILKNKTHIVFETNRIWGNRNTSNNEKFENILFHQISKNLNVGSTSIKPSTATHSIPINPASSEPPMRMQGWESV